MITTTDITPFAGTVGGAFFVGLITGYAIRKVIKLAAVIWSLYRSVSVFGVSTDSQR